MHISIIFKHIHVILLLNRFANQSKKFRSFEARLNDPGHMIKMTTRTIKIYKQQKPLLVFFSRTSINNESLEAKAKFHMEPPCKGRKKVCQPRLLNLKRKTVMG